MLALYYPWYGLATWSDPVLSDRPGEPYDGSDPATLLRHVRWARDAGIDVLVVGWFGPSPSNITETNIAALLRIAAAEGIRVAVLVEMDSDDFFPTLEAQRVATEHALAVHAQHPAYFRYEGKPVLFFWHPRGIWTDGSRAGRDGPPAVAAWRAFRDDVDPARSSLWIAETEHAPYLEVFDGMFPYSIAWARDPASQLRTFATAARSFATRLGERRLWIATAMPGYDDTGLLERANRFAVDRAGGDYYRRTFAGAVATAPDWINISSFNEWVEGHQIEPSMTYGDLYLDLTRELVSAWKRSPE